jgi:hypothetical protein
MTPVGPAGAEALDDFDSFEEDEGIVAQITGWITGNPLPAAVIFGALGYGAYRYTKRKK